MRIRLLFLLGLLLSGTQLLAQSRVTGTILDSKTNEPLIGATVIVKGTTTAASASLTGGFKITIPAPGTGTLVFSYIGYVSKEISVSGAKDLGSIKLESNSSSLNEVVINAPAIDRKTPIAVSTINAEFIEEKGQGLDFPELLKETPGVMATESGGGYGDSRVSIRGFSANNVAVLINGIPVNDVETGRVYWSDWAGLTDVTSSIQVQRGLGASKVSTPSLGGTIAITTRSLDAQPGGYLIGAVGSYGANKIGVSAATGLNEKGWASSFLLAKSTGDGVAQGLYYTGYSYFFNLTKVLSKTQTLSFNAMGASQSHGQRFTRNPILTYKNAPQAERYNSDWGYYNGQIQSAEINYYNKPILSLNHIWTINSTTDLSTVGYASFGTGASRYLTNSTNATSPYTTIPAGAPTSYPRTGDIYSPLDINAVAKNNANNADGSALNYFQNVSNNHQTYGVLSTLKKKFGEYVDATLGADLRYYTGEHFNQVQDLLSAQYVNDVRKPVNTTTNINSGTGDINNPTHRAVVGDKFNNDYRFDIASEGLFLQAEYSRNKLSAFGTFAANTTAHKRIDYFDYLNSDPNRESSWVNFLGYQAKAGANYNLDSHSNVFANIGYLQKPPLVANIFVNKNNSLNLNAVPEKLFSYELGYGFRSSEFTANINLYRTTYKDKSEAPTTVINSDGSTSSANLSGINELHQGVEFDARYRPNRAFTLRGMLSIGSWTYSSDAGPAQVTSDAATAPINIAKLYIKGLNVGDAAQTTSSLGFDANITSKFKAGPTWFYYANYTGLFFPDNVTKPGYVPYKVPNYSLFDINTVFRFKISGLDAVFLGNVRNVFNTAYISDSRDVSGSANTPSTVGVYYGTGRIYTTTLKVKF